MVRSVMVRSVMGLFRRGQRRGPEDDEAAARFDAAASAAARLRGENLTPMPADDTATSIDNVSAAARDYGLSRFSGESDADGASVEGLPPGHEASPAPPPLTTESSDR